VIYGARRQRLRRQRLPQTHAQRHFSFVDNFDTSNEMLTTGIT